ncbi:LysR family transcriptional regulator [Thioalkalivibrio sp. ARh3]|uniref:LysR family transcriptional regulator n=1 Tax=Thioalkalivibrio sp. ARh3 TaxID=1158148 RepID=UPI00037BFFA8|nr:LysR family transcriptional regulator [Thioalkalivibrio sp. ARh3]
MKMQDLNDLYYFARVVEHGGFAPAARALGEPKSKLSRRIAALEERLGVRLLQRSTRHVGVTEIGRIYHGFCKAMLVQAEAAQDAIDGLRDEPCGTVKLSCPVALLDARVATMLAEYQRRYPRVQLHLDATNRRVDVIEEGFDIAIRVEPPPLEDSELVLRVLADRAQRLVASPDLLQREGSPQVPADLADLPSLALSRPQARYQWHLVGSDGGEAWIAHQPRLVTRSMTALRIAACHGVGIVQLPTMMMTTELADGRLVPVLEDWAPPREIVHAVFPSRRGQLPAVRGLIDHLAEGFAALDED